jgi:hypothetical protein
MRIRGFDAESRDRGLLYQFDGGEAGGNAAKMPGRYCLSHIQKSVTGLADAKFSTLMSKMRIFDDNVAEVLFFFENPVIEAPLNREIHF